MSVKILGGRARGFTLATPKSDTTRPTSVLIRRKLFDWRQNLEGYFFVDLFAGSGSMGLEALSRGADKIYFNDSHRAAYQTIKQNAEKIVVSHKFEAGMIDVSHMDSIKWLTREMNFHAINQENTILYLDPPYENHSLYRDVLKALKEMQFQGEVWIESDRLKGLVKEELTQALNSVIKVVEQGDHFVLVGKVI